MIKIASISQMFDLFKATALLDWEKWLHSAGYVNCRIAKISFVPSEVKWYVFLMNTNCIYRVKTL